MDGPINDFVRHLKSLAGASGVLRLLRLRWRFPRLFFRADCEINVSGSLSIGRTTSLEKGLTISVPHTGRLDIGEHCYIGRHVELGASSAISIGSYTTIQTATIILGNVAIGRYCVLGPNIYISSGTHHFREHPALYIKDQDRLVASSAIDSDDDHQKVRLEEDCWLGANVTIMRGVTLGRGCVVGANSVVTKNLKPYSVAVGCPAKVVKHRLEFVAKRSISATIEEHFPYFYSGFGCSIDERRRVARFKAIEAFRKFSVVLRFESTSEQIQVVCRAARSGAFILNYGHQSQAMTQDFSALVFTVDEKDLLAGRAEFVVAGDLGDKGDGPCLLVQGVSVLVQGNHDC